MATRTLKAPNGAKLTLSSEALDSSHLALAEVLLELAVEQGSAQVTVSEDELARRLVAKGLRSSHRQALALGHGSKRSSLPRTNLAKTASAALWRPVRGSSHTLHAPPSSLAPTPPRSAAMA